MRGDLGLLYAELERSPEDWSVRLRLIESAVETDNLEEAKRLVRSSPEDQALPPELQERIHHLLSRGDGSASESIGV